MFLALMAGKIGFMRDREQHISLLPMVGGGQDFLELQIVHHFEGGHSADYD